MLGEVRPRIPAITGVGLALPNRIIPTSEVQDLFSSALEKRQVRSIAYKIRVSERHWVMPGEASSDLGTTALRNAVEMAGVNLSDITSVVFATSTPDFMAVPTAAILQAKLGMPEDIVFHDKDGNACSGLLLAIRDAFSDISSPYGITGPHAVLGVEVLSGSLSTSSPDIATMFGDGGSALIIENVIPDEGTPTRMGFAFGADGQYGEALYVPGGGSVNFTNAETVRRNMHVLKMDNQVVGREAIRRMVEMASLAMERAGITPQNSILIPHQANGMIMDAVAGQLEFPQDQVVSTIDHTGNTSAASTGIALAEAVGKGMVNRNDYVVMVAFGAGFMFGALAIPMVGLPVRKG